MLKKIIIGTLLITSPFCFAAPDAKFLTISDVHFDPFADCHVLSIAPCATIAKLRAAPVKDWGKIFDEANETTPSTYGSDTNYFLLKSSLTEIAAQTQQEHPEFALILGDFLAHNFHRQYILYAHDRSQQGFHNFVKKTFQFLTLAFRQAIPDIDIFPVMGNNDAYEDYQVTPAGQVLRENKDTWATLFKNKNNLDNFRHTFSDSGYYVVNNPANKNQSIIVLNTVLFSSHVKDSKTRQAASAELNWFHDQLKSAAAEHRQVMIAFHIPLGIDVYRTMQSFLGGIKEFWQPQYTVIFNKDLAEYPSTVTAILAGHIHIDNFQVLREKQSNEVPVNFTPSISPIYGNNPTFKIYSYDPDTFKLLDSEKFYYSLNKSEKTWIKEGNTPPASKPAS
jgi:sphingomyelin phosphodiesterase acid-like 3